MSLITDSDPRNLNSVSRIKVKGLFGHYNYLLPALGEEHKGLSRLLILYGDNGSGKTTILKLLCSLLSSQDKSGHRTFVAKQRFREFVVELLDGTVISAVRDGSDIVGDYRLSISKSGTLLASVDLEVNEKGAINTRSFRNRQMLKDYRRTLDALREIDLDPFFLSDDRRILGRERKERVTYEFITEQLLEGKVSRDDEQYLPLDRAIMKMENWIKQQVFKGSSLGQTNTNTIYTEIVKRITQYPSGRQADIVTASQKQELIDTLEDLSVRSRPFSALGLTSAVDLYKIAEMLRGADESTQDLIYHIIKPYVESTEARFDALEDIKNLITVFLGHLNSFYTDKEVDFNLDKGLVINLKWGEKKQLEPNRLSSGEKQLLLLFCTTLSAQNRPRLFVIDEPEISLNVKWQRGLIQALLECSSQSDIQFILATHSIELLTQYKEHTVRLTHIHDEVDSE
jgi:energy-coupling factor transporter ATP-binding protein EcfA2